MGILLYLSKQKKTSLFAKTHFLNDMTRVTRLFSVISLFVNRILNYILVQIL